MDAADLNPLRLKWLLAGTAGLRGAVGRAGVIVVLLLVSMCRPWGRVVVVEDAPLVEASPCSSSAAIALAAAARPVLKRCARLGGRRAEN